MTASSDPGLLRLPDPARAAAWCADVRARGERLGFVPTMGALHEGHLSLVRRSVAENERTCVSVFVNPLQFDDAEDLARYPRDLEGDARLLAATGCDMLFTGTLAGFFPEAGDTNEIPLRDPGAVGRGLEGDHRPGHFAGVATIVRRLFDVVAPNVAYFGEKDFQQTLVVRSVVPPGAPPGIVVCPTSREVDGLARSSRNVRLSRAGRRSAAGLSAALFVARRRWRAGERDARALGRVLEEELARWGLTAEYAAVRDPGCFRAGEPEGALVRARAFLAVPIDGVRLIDTLDLDGNEPEPEPEREARAGEAGEPGRT